VVNGYDSNDLSIRYHMLSGAQGKHHSSTLIMTQLTNNQFESCLRRLFFFASDNVDGGPERRLYLLPALQKIFRHRLFCIYLFALLKVFRVVYTLEHERASLLSSLAKI
jgi:hypothetical protein